MLETVKSVSRDNGRDLWFGEVSAWLREFSGSSTLFASRNRNPKEGGPDSPPWMTHEQGRSASSNQGIPPHYAVLDLGTTKRERGEGSQALGNQGPGRCDIVACHASRVYWEAN